MKISVLMSVFNGEDFLVETIESILSQDTDDFEFIVVNDGSTDKSGEILQSYDRVNLKYLKLPFNCGIGMARNFGLRQARGEYIAIMDADDIALPQRLSSQAAFLDSHLDIDILGCRTIRIQNTIDDIINKPNHPLIDSDIKARLISLNGTALIKPTAMIRKHFLDTHKLSYASVTFDEDHEFWIRCVEAGATFHTLEERLLYKRRHQQNISSQSVVEKAPGKFSLRKKLLGMFYPKLTIEELNALALIMTKGMKISYNQSHLGITSAKKALTESRSIYGESKKLANSLLIQYVKVFQEQFNRTTITRHK